MDAAPAKAIAGAPQLGLLCRQVEDLHSVCFPNGIFQAEQHDVMFVVPSRDAGVTLLDAQVESRVGEVCSSLE